MPAVTVIIPNYNHASFLKERIDSVLAQSFTDFEVIILDDASTDNSREIIEPYRNSPFVKEILYNNFNTGLPYSQWQKALASADGKWIWIAESDDKADPSFLEKIMQLQQLYPDAALLYCDSRMIIENSTTPPVLYSAIKNKELNTDKWSKTYKAEGVNEIKEALQWKCTINNVSAALFRKDVLAETMPAVKNYRYHGDWVLYLHLALKYKIAYTPEVLNTYREHSANHSKSLGFQKESKKEHFRILDFLLQAENVTDKKKLIQYFAKNYCGFGWIKEKPFAADGAYSAYKKINPRLAKKLLLQLFLQKMKLP